MIELVLQILGAGGDDHLLIRQQGRNQVGEGLAGAGAGLGDQYAGTGHSIGHILSHLQLLGAVGKTIDVLG